MPLRKVHELTFLWFGLAGPLLIASEPPKLWELRNIYHHHPESKKKKSSQENSGFIHPYGRYGNAVKTRKTISTIASLWPVKAIFEKRAATVEVDSFLSPETSKKSLQKRFHAEACRSTVLFLGGAAAESEAMWLKRGLLKSAATVSSSSHFCGCDVERRAWWLLANPDLPLLD